MYVPIYLSIYVLTVTYVGILHMTDDMLGPKPMHIKYSSYVYDGFCIWRNNSLGPNESAISKFTCIYISSAPLWY